MNEKPFSSIPHFFEKKLTGWYLKCKRQDVPIYLHEEWLRSTTTINLQNTLRIYKQKLQSFVLSKVVLIIFHRPPLLKYWWNLSYYKLIWFWISRKMNVRLEKILTVWASNTQVNYTIRHLPFLSFYQKTARIYFNFLRISICLKIFTIYLKILKLKK